MAILCLSLLAFLAADTAWLAAMILVRPEGAFSLIMQKFHQASIAPVHILRIIPVVKFLGIFPFRNSIIYSFDGFRNAARANAGIVFFLNPLIVLVRFTPTGIPVVQRRIWHFFPSSLPLWKMVARSRPVRQPVNGFIGALVLLQNAFTQYLCGRVLLLRWIGGKGGSLSVASVPKRTGLPSSLRATSANFARASGRSPSTVS